MPHFASYFSIHRLELDARLGVSAAERATAQKVTISLRIYHPKPLACASNDHAAFIDYHALCDAMASFVHRHEFRLIEFMAQEIFSLARAYVTEHGSADMAVWLRLTKQEPAVAFLKEGAAFTVCDLPADATVAPE